MLIYANLFPTSVTLGFKIEAPTILPHYALNPKKHEISFVITMSTRLRCQHYFLKEKCACVIKAQHSVIRGMF